ncbi:MULTISPECIES: carbonic anhydrase [unclassified Sphingomonas]|uniref:carbonic anhydrase n=1 Tax=unclassified Sphingomonas TaxID=196159 RepID=UPI0006F2B8B1|nr:MULTISPECIES: carbonic anhydrase [unclassified Sphingomonas]KQX20088.1 carbonate dehydratase [Sphingomonas sp. Root1294]KQY67339.1 carbonate dehydratase [Sphingomonas sp. Root50]KRB90716.1 carbonate dehydratase [Sphingomonas sp. Root720]
MTDFSDLIEGYRRFKAKGWEDQRERWTKLAGGQDPRLMVIACSDSRVDPTIIFDTSPGEIFMVRNVANMVPPFETTAGHHGVSAALEFAVTQLEVPEIVVLGHQSCGGCAAALTRRFQNAEKGQGGFIDDWMSLLDDARDRVIAEHGHGEEAVRALELEAVKVSIANLRTFPCVPIRERKGRLKIHGAYFGVADGILHILDEATGAFSPA